MELFGKSTRGKRLKSADRIEGTLPFVTAGEADEGVSAFIGNDVEVFRKNYGSRSKKGEIPRFELSHNALNRKPQK